MDARLRYPMINVSWLENYFKFQWSWNWEPTWSILQLINGRTWSDYRHFRQRTGTISSCSVNIHFIILLIDENSSLSLFTIDTLSTNFHGKHMRAA